MTDRYPVPARVSAGSRSPVQTLDHWRAAWLRAQADPDGFWLAEAKRRL